MFYFLLMTEVIGDRVEKVDVWKQTERLRVNLFGQVINSEPNWPKMWTLTHTLLEIGMRKLKSKSPSPPSTDQDDFLLRPLRKVYFQQPVIVSFTPQIPSLES